MDLWPATRARNFAAVLEKEGHLVKPSYLRRWSRDAALDAMAAYMGVDRPTFEKMHPIDVMAHVNRFGYCPFVGLGVNWPTLDRLLPRDVICAYRGPCLPGAKDAGPALSADWLWSGPSLIHLNMDTTLRVNQKRVRDAELLWAREQESD
jgi:hypothetical protein